MIGEYIIKQAQVGGGLDISDPYTRLLIGAGLGGLLGFTYEGSKKKNRLLTPKERTAKALQGGLLGAAIGGGVSTVPLFLE